MKLCNPICGQYAYILNEIEYIVSDHYEFGDEYDEDLYYCTMKVDSGTLHVRTYKRSTKVEFVYKNNDGVTTYFTMYDKSVYYEVYKKVPSDVVFGKRVFTAHKYEPVSDHHNVAYNSIKHLIDHFKLELC